MNSYGLKEILAAAISGAEEFCVRPDFGVKGGAAGVEYADDLPLYRAERDHIADRQAGVALGGVFSDDNFGDPRREHPPSAILMRRRISSTFFETPRS